MSPENDFDPLIERLLEKVPEKNRNLASEWILKKRSKGKTPNSPRTYINAMASLSSPVTNEHSPSNHTQPTQRTKHQ